MNKFLRSKKGVTILEGLIAMTLLAVVATGTFAVLLATSRKTSAPDIREEMSFAVEKAHSMLQAYIMAENVGWADGVALSDIPTASQKGLCGGDNNPLGNGSHNINCMLPPLCDRAQSSFAYNVATRNYTNVMRASDTYVPRNASGVITSGAETAGAKYRQINFTITCNGFTLQ